MNPNPFNEPPSNAQVDRAREAANALAERAKESAAHLADRAKDGANNLADKAKETASHLADSARDAARKTSQVAQDTYESARTNLDDTIERTRTYVRENPVPAVIGAFAIGAVVSFILTGARRHEPTFRERYVDDPLESIRDTVYAALAPVGKRLHDQYDSARESAADALDHAQDSASRHANSWSKQIRRAGHNLKFW